MSKRQKFFLGHLIISVVISIIFIGIVFLCWYPSPLAKAVGVTHIFLMLIFIDVILGPILGLLVYKEGKKTLKMDLSIIILVQIFALSYGIYNIAEGRPVWIVQNGDRFELIRNNDLVYSNVEKIKPQYQSPSWFKPQYVSVFQGKTISERNKNLFEAITTGVSNAMRPELYIPLSEGQKQLIEASKRLDTLNQFNDNQNVKSVLSKYPEADAWCALAGLSVDMVVLINKEKGEVIKIVDLRPWN